MLNLSRYYYGMHIHTLYLFIYCFLSEIFGRRPFGMKIDRAWIAVPTRYHSFFIRDGYKKLKNSEWGVFSFLYRHVGTMIVSDFLHHYNNYGGVYVSNNF